jgi:SAM-dependent methyltransferase
MTGTYIGNVQTISPRLDEFVNQFPWDRRSILEFMLRAASELPPGARVLDVGAGEAPYAELFQHVDYQTSDWSNSVHAGARRADYIGSADDLPVQDAMFDAVLNTQVLEHVSEPARVVAELHRILKPGGRVYVTVPLVGALHEEPYDFYRYTPHGLRHLLQNAGFVNIDVRPRNDSFTTLAQVMCDMSRDMGRRADGLDPMRDMASQTLRGMADIVASFAHLDTRRILPLGYSVTAMRRLRVDGSRSIAVAAFASELIESPDLLRAYTTHVTGADDVTLAVLTSTEEMTGLQQAVQALGVDAEGSADIMAVPPTCAGVCAFDALLSRNPAPAELASVPRYDERTICDLQTKKEIRK